MDYGSLTYFLIRNLLLLRFSHQNTIHYNSASYNDEVVGIIMGYCEYGGQCWDVAFRDIIIVSYFGGDNSEK